MGAWASSSSAPYKYLDVPHTTRELKSGPISWCVRRPNICTGPASSGRGVWALVFWPDYLRFTDPTIIFPDPSVDTRVPRTAPALDSEFSFCLRTIIWAQSVEHTAITFEWCSQHLSNIHPCTCMVLTTPVQILFEMHTSCSVTN